MAKKTNKSCNGQPQRKIVKRRLSQLRPHPRQREIFPELSENAIQELADDIDANGLTHPIEVKHDNTIIAGHRRLAAAKLLGWTEVTCWVRDDLSDADADRRHIDDNLLRRQLTKLGVARAYKALKQLDDEVLRNGEAGDLRDILGRKLGVDGRTLDRLARILECPITIQEAYDTGQLNQAEALAVVALKVADRQRIAKWIRDGSNRSRPGVAWRANWPSRRWQNPRHQEHVAGNADHG